MVGETVLYVSLAFIILSPSASQSAELAALAEQAALAELAGLAEESDDG